MLVVANVTFEQLASSKDEAAEVLQVILTLRPQICVILKFVVFKLMLIQVTSQEIYHVSCSCLWSHTGLCLTSSWMQCLSVHLIGAD